MRAGRAETGQATVEWIGLVLLVALTIGAVLAVAAGGIPGTALARMVGERLICAVRLGDCTEAGRSALEAAYGRELAAMVARHAPEIRYELGEPTLPVDFRTCRRRRCSDGPLTGDVWTSHAGERATAFVHVVDCRRPDSGQARCDGSRAGNAYLQYWLYYPDSNTRGPIGDAHLDDWESYQVRIGAEGVVNRASSHHSYNHGAGPGSALSDPGLVKRSGWGPDTGYLWVSHESHAGRTSGGSFVRTTPRGMLRLVPLEPLLGSLRRYRFAVSPPWRKAVWDDPEAKGT